MIKLVPYDLQNEQDVSHLFEVIKEYFSSSPFPPSKEKIKNGDVKYFRAMNDQLQIGISGYVSKTPALVETVKTTVFKDFQGSGFGKALSDAIENECKRAGFKKVMTTIFHFNHTMISIKLAQGYVIEGFHRDHEAPGFHEYSLGKVLT